MTDPWQPGGGQPPPSQPPPPPPPPPPPSSPPGGSYPPAGGAPGYPPAPGYPGAPPPGGGPPPGGFPPPPPPGQGPGGYPPAGYPGPGVPGWGPQPAPGYDGFAIAALVTGILPCAPVGIILGIVALTRIGRSGQRGKGMAIAGIVLSAIWIGLFVLGAIVGGDAERDDEGTITDAGDEDVFDLRVGDCFNDPPQDEELETVSAVPCSEPHDAEVYAEFDTAEEGDAYPGESALGTEAGQGCSERFEDFVGVAPESSSLSVHFLLPTQLSWDNIGDREITCLVVDPSGPTTGSLEGAAR